MPIHIGESSRAARRVRRRGDGYFPGGMLMPAERAEQMDFARSTAVAAGRDPAAREHTRWGSIDMPRDRVDGFAAQGVTRVVVGVTATDEAVQFDEISAFAARFGLTARS